jgi:SAM-dependent methyltransferase
MTHRLFDDLKFSDYQINERRETLTAVDSTGKLLIKVQVKANPRKTRTIADEYSVMKKLNHDGCQSCPVAHEFGQLSVSELGGSSSLVSGLPPDSLLSYIIQDYVVDEGNYNLADVLLTLIEQKKLGVYQGDVKPSNVRFNPKTGVCVFIDYDQSELLNETQKNMSNSDFLKYCDAHDKEKYGFGNWLRHYPNVSNSNTLPYFTEGSLNLANTSVFKSQKTTNSSSGIYHTIYSNDVYAIGSRGMGTRAELLDTVEFSKDERVLDVGCNAGLLCEYLHDRGCRVTGVDNDPHIVVAAKMISNILGRKIEYACVDLDYVDSLDRYDTIMLFSVFHHTRDTVANAKKIVESCKRIIIETRLVENGKQPIGGQWVDTTKWSFKDLNHLVDYLESTFEGFEFKRNVGFADKGRYILELVKR